MDQVFNRHGDLLMTILGQFTFAAPSTTSNHDPVAAAKTKLLANLNEQLKAAKLMVEGKPSDLTERKKWYGRHDDAGNMLFVVKVINKPVEFSKGMTAIVVKNDKDLPNVIEKIIQAVEADELKKQIDARVKEKANQRKAA